MRHVGGDCWRPDLSSSSGFAVSTTHENDSAPKPIPWRMLVRDAAGLWLAWQAIVIAFTYTALTFAVANSQRSVPAYVVTPNSFYEAWVRWDGQWYALIAAKGYAATPGMTGTLAFFSLIPAAHPARLLRLSRQHSLSIGSRRPARRLRRLRQCPGARVARVPRRSDLRAPGSGDHARVSPGLLPRRAVHRVALLGRSLLCPAVRPSPHTRACSGRRGS